MSEQSNLKRHQHCPMRTHVGNCIIIGGFCTSIREDICDALHKSFQMGTRNRAVDKANDDAVRCYEFLKERIGSEITDNAEEFEKWFERMVWHVQKCNEYDTEMRNVSEDCDNCIWNTCNYNKVPWEVGEWINKQEKYQMAECSNCKKVTMHEMWGDKLVYYDYCPNCGAKMKG